MVEPWRDYQKHVLSELKRCSDLHELTDQKITDLTIIVTKLQVKAGLWGSIAGALTIIGSLIVERFTK